MEPVPFSDSFYTIPMFARAIEKKLAFLPESLILKKYANRVKPLMFLKLTFDFGKSVYRLINSQKSSNQAGFHAKYCGVLPSTILILRFSLKDWTVLFPGKQSNIHKVVNI